MPLYLKNPLETSMNFAVWLVLGAGVGAAIGAAMKNVAIGVAIGVGLGVALGLITSGKQKE